MLTQDELRRRLDYNEATGLFTWKQPLSNRVKVGSIAGTVRADGYCRIKIGGDFYYAHRLAWLYVHGEMPRYIDHIDCDPNHNWIGNLRPATHSQNHGNKHTPRNNSLGVKNVCYSKVWKKWVVQVQKGENRYAAMFPCLGHACRVAAQKRVELFGEFARG